jgi:hypothetical protein
VNDGKAKSWWGGYDGAYLKLSPASTMIFAIWSVLLGALKPIYQALNAEVAEQV